ncbi:MAG: NAD(P)H-dependent oxidoreductase [Spiroplasma ixodetis]|nr:NAD(P)H-dependent oxidoreductase [Spiroplasma ixodetis]MBP1526594.1 NAD(P)H-dependent oxidoreductase [Spiroplasma ixodetis]MBP1528406.1 NAD(P)H-dependent oxidoreductase [Spiroplasma ixodetis]
MINKEKIALIACHPFFKTKSINSKNIFIRLNKKNINDFLFLENEYNNKKNIFQIHNTIKVLNENNHIIFLFPIWWFNVPWTMKLWMDEILSIYCPDKRKYENKKFTFIVTCDRKKIIYTENNVGTIEKILWPIISVFEYYMGWKYNKTYALFEANKAKENEWNTFTKIINQELLND